MKLDETFLKPHPRTLEWWDERETCRKCKHCVIEEPIPNGHKTGYKGGGWHCKAVRGPGGWYEKGKRNNLQDASCIRAREGSCGHEARLFEEKR